MSPSCGGRDVSSEVDPVNRALRAATIGVLLLGPVTLSACSAGQVNQTALQVRDKVGTTVSVGDLVLRQVALEYPKGGRYAAGDDAVLNMAIVNEGARADTLVSISGPGFEGVAVTGSGSEGTVPLGPTAALPQPTGATVSGAAGSAAAGGSTAAGGSSAAGGSQSSALPSEAPSGETNIPIPSDTVVFLGKNAPHVALVGLTRPVTAAQSLAVTFTFENAGPVTVRVIVATPDTVLPPGSTYNFQQDEKGNRPDNQVGGGIIAGSNTGG
jgi:copper(I)-binding protein